MFRVVFSALLALLVAGTAFATTDNKTVVEKNVPDFLAKQQMLRKDLQDTKKFSHIDNQSKAKIYAAQDVLFDVLRDKQSVDQLNADEKVKVYNAQTEIAAIMENAEADRPICQNKPKMGSHLAQIECVSQRQRTAEREQWHTRLLDRNACSGGLCSGN
jgi:hypothetical protein